MPPANPEKLADGLLRRVRPALVAFLSAALTEPEPVADEEAHISERAAQQLARFRARASKTAKRPRKPKP